ncbi:MAG TPA: molybdopterin molybdotransferase MoeA [Hyphomicrobiaceae bacterium]|nr:molybdopterin molybdotransferase MoeA [Hyphomicrobiaceae bacterium]
MPDNEPSSRTTPKLVDDCFRIDGRRLTHGEAIALLKERAAPIAGETSVTLAEADGRVIARPIVAPRPIPMHANSAVDGYAFAWASYDRERGSTLPVVGRAAAGRPMREAVPAGAAARIFTGAAMPAGTDTVVMQEDTATRAVDGRDCVVVPPGLKTRANARAAGEDVATGQKIFEPGHAIRPQDIAALASLGLAVVPVFDRLKVAIVASGDEIVRPDSKRAGAIEVGQVYDANSPMLAALLRSPSIEVDDLGVLPDDAAKVRARLVEAAELYDVILTSGGASLGDEDHMVAAIDALGTRHMWQLAIKPGRPISFGQIGRAVIVGLPGNPVAVFVCYLMYVYPLLRRLAGAPWPTPRRLSLPALFSFKGRKKGRREFWRGMLVDGPDGLGVDKFMRDGSGLISSLRAADGLIDICEDQGDVAPGDFVDFISFSEFGLAGR